AGGRAGGAAASGRAESAAASQGTGNSTQSEGRGRNPQGRCAGANGKCERDRSSAQSEGGRVAAEAEGTGVRRNNSRPPTRGHSQYRRLALGRGFRGRDEARGQSAAASYPSQARQASGRVEERVVSGPHRDRRTQAGRGAQHHAPIPPLKELWPFIALSRHCSFAW